MKILSNWDFVKNQILNVVLHVVAGTPSSPVEGQIWYDTTADRVTYYDGSANRVPWTANGDIPNAEITNAKLATNPLARANHTGTQLASTISDFDTQVRTNRLDQMTAPTATVSWNSQKISNLADGTAANDAINKGQLDLAVTGFSWKQAVRVATTAAGTLATSFENGDTIDGVVLATGNRILIKDQAAGADNGIYVVAASGAPTRATDADSSAELQGAAVMVQEGTANANTQWIQTVDGTITLGSTTITWTQFGGSSTYLGGAGLTLTGSTFDVGAGTGITVDATNVNIDTAVVVRKFAANIGDGSTTAIAVTHSLGTKDITWSIRTVSDDTFVQADVTATSTTVATFTFAVAPTTNQYRVCIHA